MAAGPLRAVVIRTDVAGAPVRQVEPWIVGAGHPDRTATMFPRVRIAEGLGLGRTAFPRLGTGLTRRGDCVEPPRFASGHGVIGSDEAPDAVLAAAHAYDDLVLDDQRRVRNRVPGFGTRHLGLPDGTAGFPVDRDQLRVEGTHEQGVAKDPQPTITGAATDDAILGRRIAIEPERSTGRRIERDD